MTAAELREITEAAKRTLRQPPDELMGEMKAAAEAGKWCVYWYAEIGLYVQEWFEENGYKVADCGGRDICYRISWE